jgi:tartrate dehydratase alpha subunit/fumarate hydratase class I-like protein
VCQIGDKVSSTADALKSGIGEAKDRADEMARISRYAVTDFINENPLLVAGIGAVVGAVIAASIPPSEAENRLFGAGSEKLKDKAREAAAQGIEKVGDLAAETAGSVAAAAAREGLDAVGVTGALSKVAGGVRAVADRGLDTALGEKKQSQPNSSFEYPASERNH